jgi:hypothetical protein
VTSRLSLAVLLFLLAPTIGVAQPGSAQDLKVRIGELSSLDYSVRTNAARQIRRVAAAEASAALLGAVLKHPDEFVRYRALVLLTAFNDRTTSLVMRDLMRDKNDRLREIAYKWFEEHPDRETTAMLLAALQTEQAEFVRPALVGALAAIGTDPQIQRALLAESARGLDFFRSAVIEALGRHRATYAVDTLVAMAKIDGPLLDDVVLALGRIGDPRASAVLDEVSKGTAEAALTARAARCLLGRECELAIKTLTASATGSRAATTHAAIAGLAALGASGSQAAVDALTDVALRVAAAREDAAVGLATVAVRRPGLIITWLDRMPPDRRAAPLGLLKDGFDTLEEDFGEEQFFAMARAAYWQAAEGSPSRALLAAVIDKLEF